MNYDSLSSMLNIGDEIIIDIENISSTGAGVGFYEADTPRAIFVPLSVPGDTLKVRIVNQKKVYFEAEIVEIVKESPYRIKPVCGHFGVCGACDHLNMDYDKQVDEKKKMLEFFFNKADILIPEVKVIKAKNPLHYRDKARFTKGGFFARKSNEIIKISECPLMNLAYDELIASGEADGSYGYDYKARKVTKEIAYYNVGKNELRYDPLGFVQNNLMMNEVLVNEVVSLVESGESLLDMYCGNGNFTIPLSFKFRKVDAVEGAKGSFSLLIDNLKLNGVKNVSAHNDDSKDYAARRGKHDYVVLDPPRAGSDDVLIHLSEQTQNIIYVSCDALVLSKELKRLKRHCSFSIEDVVLIDMFPQTRHFETVVSIKISSAKV